jgi:hypothetical protein
MQPIFGQPISLPSPISTVLVFIPNLASPYAKEAALSLKEWVRPLDLIDVKLVVVSMTHKEIASDSIPRLLLKYPVVLDPEGEIFQMFSIQPAPLRGLIPRHLPRVSFLRSLIEWRTAFRARGGLFILKDEHILHEEYWTNIDTQPDISQVMNHFDKYVTFPHNVS